MTLDYLVGGEPRLNATQNRKILESFLASQEHYEIIRRYTLFTNYYIATYINYGLSDVSEEEISSDDADYKQSMLPTQVITMPKDIINGNLFIHNR